MIVANKIILDLQGLTSEWDLHEYLKKRFAFPEYYGHNASALWDCLYLWFQEPTVIEIKNLDKLPANMKSEEEVLRKVFQRLDREDRFLQVVFKP